MKENRQNCERGLRVTEEAYICSYECTFCRDCDDTCFVHQLNYICRSVAAANRKRPHCAQASAEIVLAWGPKIERLDPVIDVTARDIGSHPISHRQSEAPQPSR